MGLGAEAKKLVVKGVMEDVPLLAPKKLTPHHHGWAKGHFEACYTVPGFAECLTRLWHLTTPIERRQETEDRRQKKNQKNPVDPV
jgi:hypothetical protein